MDEYQVEVRDRSAREVTLYLRRRNKDATLPLGLSFASMLITDESCPTHAAWIAARDRESAANVNFWLKDHIAAMFLRAIYDPQPETATYAGDYGGARVCITMDRDGLLEHLEPGLCWVTTAYDENGDCVHFDFDTPGLKPLRWMR